MSSEQTNEQEIKEKNTEQKVESKEMQNDINDETRSPENKKRKQPEEDGQTEEKEVKKVKYGPEKPPKVKPKRKVRLARRQVEEGKGPKLQKEEVMGEYNIWYHKYIGQNRDNAPDAEPAETRVDIAKDSGWTVACTNKDPYFCIFFARGCCPKGPDCRWLHRIPTMVDEQRIPITKDCFGRDKHSTDRDDMGGVGNFNRECKTLFITGLKNIPGSDMEEQIIRHFKEFGQLEYVRVFPERCYAFLKYKLRLCAEFAKEAMMNQALDADEVLQIKWATEDPNPMAQQREIIEKRQALMKTLNEKGISTKPLPYNYPKDYVPPDTKLPENLEKKEKLMREAQKQRDQEEGYTGTNQEYIDFTSAQHQDSLDYHNFIHQSFKQNRLNEKSVLAQQREFYEQKQIINSEVCDPYPNTDEQYRQQQEYQKQIQEFNQYYYQQYYAQWAQQQGTPQLSNTAANNEGYNLHEYYTYDPTIYRAFANMQRYNKPEDE